MTPKAKTKEPKPIIYTGSLSDIGPLWAASSDTHDARVDPITKTLTVVHKDGERDECRVGDAVVVRDKRIVVLIMTFKAKGRK